MSKVLAERQSSFLIAKKLDNAAVTLVPCLQTPLRAFPPSLTRLLTPFRAFPFSPPPDTCVSKVFSERQLSFLIAKQLDNAAVTLIPRLQHLVVHFLPNPTPYYAFHALPLVLTKVFSERQLSFLIAKLKETFKGTPEEAVGKYTTGLQGSVGGVNKWGRAQ